MDERAKTFDEALAAVSLDRKRFARLWRVSEGRVRQIATGHGLQYAPAMAICDYINQLAGRVICTVDLFQKTRKGGQRSDQTRTTKAGSNKRQLV